MFHVSARSFLRRASTRSAAGLVILLAAPAAAAEPQAQAPGVVDHAARPAPAPADPSAAPGEFLRVPDPTPLVAELLAAVEAERQQLARLRREIAATHEHARKLVLQREVEALKRATELQLVTIQLVHARREGRVEHARQLEAALARMTGPVPAAPSPAAAATGAPERREEP